MDKRVMTAEHKKSPACDSEAVTILVVEDSPVQAELLRRSLEGAHYKVIMARDGAEGLAMTKAQHPAVVVSDIIMPVMDGFALCRAIRDDESVSKTPVFLVTTLARTEDVIFGLNAGADAYVTKPYHVPTLISHLQSILAHPLPPAPPAERRKVEVNLAGKTHYVDAHGPRILNLLISTYENAVAQNHELLATQLALEELNQNLEQRVQEKTAALLASERRFRALIEHASDLVTVIDTNGVISYISPSVQQMGGYASDELIGTQYGDFLLPEDRLVAAAGLAELLRNPGTPHTTQFRLRRKDGSWRTLESIARNGMNDPAIKGIVINSRDITERKQVEEELRRLNWALRALSQSNAALVHDGTEQQLFAACCDAIVGSEGYAIAWIGLVQDGVIRLEEAAADVGETLNYLQGLELTCGDTAGDVEPAGTAIRTGTTQVVNNLTDNGVSQAWIERMRRHGLASSIYLPIRDDNAVIGVLAVYAGAPDAFGKPQIELFEELVQAISYGINARRMRSERNHLQMEQRLGGERLKKALIGTIGAVALTVEKRDPYTAGHQLRVAELCLAIGRKLDLSPDRLEGVRLGATIHDIGKIYVPAEILNRPGKLTAAEFEIIKSHPQIGYDIVKGVEFPWPVTDMILQHHERLDGSGYPNGLKGDAIILEARIIAVADVVEAMSSHRPYRAEIGVEPALTQIRKEAGSKLDAQVVDICERLFREKEFSFSRA